MQTITLNVTVSNGIPPVPIKVYLDGDVIHQSISKDNSFSQGFALDSGDYSIMIGGMNQLDITTITAELSGTFSKSVIPSLQQSSNSQHYAFIFYFSV